MQTHRLPRPGAIEELDPCIKSAKLTCAGSIYGATSIINFNTAITNGLICHCSQRSQKPSRRTE